MSSSICNSGFTNLPKEMIQIILSYLDEKSLIKNMSVCKLFYKAIKENAQKFCEKKLKPLAVIDFFKDFPFDQEFKADIEKVALTQIKVMRKDVKYVGESFLLRLSHVRGEIIDRVRRIELTPEAIEKLALDIIKTPSVPPVLTVQILEELDLIVRKEGKTLPYIEFINAAIAAQQKAPLGDYLMCKFANSDAADF